MAAVNPESGKASYGYDANGNVKSQTDAQGIVTTIGYDALNRIKSKSYTVPSSSTSAATSAVTYSYDFDASGNFKGTLSSVSNAVSTTSYTHDGFGRVTSSTQSNVPGAFGYAYSLTDQLTKLTYPSGRVVSYVLDTADRVTNVQNGVNGPNYASISYNAPSAVQSMTMGNMVAHQLTWNDRLQSVTIQASSSVAGSLLTLGLFPCLSQATSCTSGNNGNLRSQQITAPMLGTVTQNYSYDPVNRLTQVQEGTAWTQAYGYDVNGNRWVSQNDASLPVLTQETPQASNWYSANNQISRFTYDPAGNLLQTCNNSFAPCQSTQLGVMNRNFTYDAENRQVAANINGAASSYGYDGNGLRVSRTVNGQTTVLAYDAFGNLTAEYGPAEASPCGTPTCYVTVDHLGSTRMLTDNTGSTNVRRYDYLPFGTELPAGVDGRSTGLGYQATPDDSNPKFTGKNRDFDTGMDWFEVRYLSGAQGRFQSPDPGNAGANPGDPQSWNGYAYVGNNPLSYTDPSGECFWCILGGVIIDAIGIVTGNPELIGIGKILIGAGAGDSVIGGLTGCGGPLGNCGTLGSGPWSENPGLGSVQNPGVFVMDFEDSMTLSDVSDFVAGAGDMLTTIPFTSISLTSSIRKHTPGGDSTNTCSGGYGAGGWLGTGLTVAIGGAGGLRAAGAAGKGLEFSHWIPARFGGPRSILNGNYVTAARHYLQDPFRFPPGWRDLGPKFNPVLRQLDRIPNVFKGTGAGAAYGTATRGASPGCGSN